MGCTITQPDPFAGVRVIAFDLDNTLVDIVRVKQAACRAAAPYLATLAGRSEAATARDLLATAFDLGLDQGDVVGAWVTRARVPAAAPVVAAARKAFAHADATAARPYDGVGSLLTLLRERGFRLALITDAPARFAHVRLQAAGLADAFEVTVTLEETAHGKAMTAPFALAAKRLGVAPNEILMVGDNAERDVAVAQAFGCRAAFAAYGATPHLRAASEAQADVALDAPLDLAAALARTPSDVVEVEGTAA